MAAYVGRNGQISITASSSGNVAFVDSWSLNGTIATADITAYGDSARKYAQTLRDATATLTMTMDRSDTDQGTLYAQFETATLGAVALRLYSGASAASSEFWAGQALLTGLTVNSAVGDKVSANINAQFTGGISYWTSGATG